MPATWRNHDCRPVCRSRRRLVNDDARIVNMIQRPRMRLDLRLAFARLGIGSAIGPEGNDLTLLCEDDGSEKSDHLFKLPRHWQSMETGSAVCRPVQGI